MFRAAALRMLADVGKIVPVRFGTGQTGLSRRCRMANPRRSRMRSPHLDKSYRSLLPIGRLDGICAVGATLAPMLILGGQQEEA